MEPEKREMDAHISVSGNAGIGSAKPPGRASTPQTPEQTARLEMLAAERGIPPELELNAEDAARRIAELEKTTRGGSRDG